VALWERQPWDTSASWDRFVTYYLAQAAPRSVDEAYRRYRLQKDGIPVTSKRAPGVWRTWSRGQDSQGNPIPGAVSWDARAKAYDEYLAKKERDAYEALWLARQMEVREADWTQGQRLRQIASDILDKAPLYDGKRRVIQGKDGDPIREITVLVPKVQEAINASKIASDLQRQAAGMSTQKIEHTGSIQVTADDFAAARDAAQNLEQELLGSEFDPDSDDLTG